MRAACLPTLAVPLLALSVHPVGAEPEDRALPPSVPWLVERAVERAREADEERALAGYAYRLISTVEKLDRDGGVEERREGLYELVRIGGEPYLRLVENDGEPIRGEDLERERKRERKFRERLRDGERADADEEDEAIRFDEDLVGRYEAELLGREEVEGRPAWALAFRPKAGKLPEERRIDKALNHSRGRIWIDAETFEVARLEFELTERVRFWWFLGSISEMRGHYVRQPVDGVWLPSHGALQIRARAFLRSIHRNQSAVWKDWRPLDRSGREAVAALEEPGADAEGR